MVHILCAKWTFLKAKRRRHNDGGGKKISSLVFVLVQRLVKYIFSLCASPGIGVVQALIIFNGHWRLIFKFKVQIQNRGVFSYATPITRTLRVKHLLAWVSLPRVINERSARAVLQKNCLLAWASIPRVFHSRDSGKIRARVRDLLQ